MPRRKASSSTPPKYKSYAARTSQRYDYQVMTFDAINEFRIREGLSPVVKGERKCMCCQRDFLSDDMARIRICDLCKILSEGKGIPECSIAIGRLNN